MLAAVKHWGTVNSVVSAKKVKDVVAKAIEHVRFPLLPPDLLTQLEKDNETDPCIPVRACFPFPHG